jgi:hypothetical protein
VTKLLTVLLALIALSGCASTISNSTTTLEPDGIVIRDLRAAAFNFSEAQRIGLLPDDDPGATCVKSVLARVDLPSESFTPQREGLISGASVAYIRAQQAKAMAAAARIGPDCEAVIGRIIIDAARVGIRLSPLR